MKLIKRAIANSCMSQAINRNQRATESFSFQTDRFTKGRFAGQVLISVAEKVLRTVVKGIDDAKENKKLNKPLTVPRYVYNVIHYLKKVGLRHSVPVVFFATEKTKDATQADESRREGRQAECGVKPKFVGCCSGIVVYS